MRRKTPQSVSHPWQGGIIASIMSTRPSEQDPAEDSHITQSGPGALQSSHLESENPANPDINTNVFHRLWYSALPRWKARFGMQSLMVALTLLGFLGALGHHLYYQSLHGQQAGDPQWPNRWGIALSSFVKIALVASVEIAYKQQAWVRITMYWNSPVMLSRANTHLYRLLFKETASRYLPLMPCLQ